MTKGCYTCRRRRIICDNGLPTCRKCRDAGKECLGYQKPLVWVKGGVASRGKMMGRSYDDYKSNSSARKSDSDNSTTIFANGAGSPFTSATQPISKAAHSEYNDLVSIQGTIPAVDYVPTPWGLVDPLFKDLSPLSRFYLFHFNQHLVSYLALYSDVRNPYRDLTCLVGDSPVLAHALAAMGALHYALVTNDDFALPWSSDALETTGRSLSPEEVETTVIKSMSQRPSSKAFEQFLGLKQRTLRQLSLDICDPIRRNDNRTLAAIMVLALLDAIESGDGEWKFHVEGAKKLLKSQEEENSPSRARGIMNWLDTFAVDECLLIQLMGSTLARPGSLSQPVHSSTMGPAVLKRLEETSWVGCPAYLLEVIFFVHAGRCFDPTTDPSPQSTTAFSSVFWSDNSNPLQSPSALVQHIQAFDPAAWAEEMQSYHFLPDLSMRIAIATVYKAAVYLYASRALSRPRSTSTTTSNADADTFTLPPDHAEVSNLLIRQIALIPIADPHFKCLIWPTFIAGAECRDPAQRPFLLEKLRALYYDVTSVNVRNEAWVLSLMWRKRDHRREERKKQRAESVCSPSLNDYDDHDDDDDFDWIQELDDSCIDWLFI